MRIIYVTNYYKPAYVYGGPVHSVSSMCEALAALGNKVTVLTTNANGSEGLDIPLNQPVQVDGVEVFYYRVRPILPRSFFYSPELAKACAEKIRHFDLAVLDIFYTQAMGPAIAACRRAKVPYVVSLRGQFYPWALGHKRLKKQLYLTLCGWKYLNSAAALHCTDHSEAEAAANLGLKPPTFIVPNAVKSASFTQLPARGGILRRLGLSDEAVVLLVLGRIHQVKRPELVLEAMAAVRRPQVNLVYAGPDEQGLIPTLRGHAERLGCADQVHFTGLLNPDEVLQAFSDADLLVMPSLSENFGMSAVEAMAAGVPVLVSEDVPVGRWAEAAEAGRVVPGTVEAFSRALRELLSNPARLKAMGLRGQEQVRRRFDVMAVARQMLARYEAIVTNHRSARQALASKDISFSKKQRIV